MNMRTRFILFLLFLMLGSDAKSQHKRPNDFYVTQQGDTIYGRFNDGYAGRWRPNSIAFTTMQGDKIHLRFDSISQYLIYFTNENRSKSDPLYYYPQSWVKIGDIFYQIFYQDSGPISVLSNTDGRVYGYNFYILKNRILSKKFLPLTFYNMAQEVFADCPIITKILDNVPNKENADKTHKATFDDAGYVVSKYNECMKH